MRSFFKLLLIISLFAAAAAIQAQEKLDLQEAISIALEQSFSMKTAELNLERSQKTLEARKRGLMTNVSMEFDLPRYSRSLQSQFNPITGSEQFYEIGQTIIEGRLFFEQPIVLTNGTFSLVGSLFGRDQFGSSGGEIRDYYSDLSLQLRQPLFTFNSLGASLERAELNLVKSERNYTRAEQNIIYNVTVSFYNVLKAKKQVEISEEKVRQTEISYETAQNKFKAGLIAEVEALQLEVDVASSKNELLAKETDFLEAENSFKLLLGIPIDQQIEIDAVIDYEPVIVDLETAVSYALENRSDLLNAETDIRLQELNVDEVDSRGSVNALLTAQYGINNNDEVFSDVFSEFQDNRRVTFTVSVPILDWGRNRREVESAEAELRLTQLNYDFQREEIKQEIISIINKLEAAEARVEVLSKSVDLAQRSYDISVQRFNAGTITSFDLSQTQLRLTDAKINSLNALIDYQTTLADLIRQTHYDFRAGR